MKTPKSTGMAWYQLDGKGLPGMTVAVTKEGRLILSNGYGHALVEGARRLTMKPCSRSKVALLGLLCLLLYWPVLEQAMAGGNGPYVSLYRSGMPRTTVVSYPSLKSLGDDFDKRYLHQLRLVQVEPYVLGGHREFVAVYQRGTGGNVLRVSSSWAKFSTEYGKMVKQGMRMVDFATYQDGPVRYLLGVYRSGQGGELLWYSHSWEDFVGRFEEVTRSGLRLMDFEYYQDGNKAYFVGVYRSGSGPHFFSRLSTYQDFIKHFGELYNQGLRLLDTEVYEQGGHRHYVGVYGTGTTGEGNLLRHDDTWEEFQQWNAKLESQGLAMIALNSDQSDGPRTPIKGVRYLGNFPKDRENGWSERLQGVAHDDRHWYFTQVGRLWKFPLTHDLAKFVKKDDLPPGVLTVPIPSRFQGDYDHFGDLDYHDGFLFIPLELKEKAQGLPRITVFKASDLSYVGSFLLKRQNRAGWCAIHPNTQLLYSSNKEIDADAPLFLYRIDWNRLRQLGKLSEDNVVLEPVERVFLYDGSGRKKLSIAPYLQGAEFSENGDAFYVVNGKGRKFDPRDGGIWVFEGRTMRFLQRSSLDGEFRFEFHPGPVRYQEPEGITILDVSKVKTPPPRFPEGGGEVHVILLDNQWIGTDEFFFKHYEVRR